MDIHLFLSYKTNINIKELNNNDLLNNNINIISNSSSSSSNELKINQNEIRNNKIFINKDLIENKINFILNKISIDNIEELILNFITTINKINLNIFEKFQDIIYNKIVSEIKFINSYLIFFKSIIYIYNNVQNYTCEYFITLLEKNIKNIYSNNTINTNFIPINENIRINNLILLKKLVDFNFISDDIINECNDIIINQNIYILDIYHWNNILKKKLSNNEINIIKNKLNNIKCKREQILLESLINNNNKNNKITDEIYTELDTEISDEITDELDTEIVNEITNEITDEIDIEINNNSNEKLLLEYNYIIDEYLIILLDEDIIYFIEKKCNNINNIKSFILIIFEKICKVNKNESLLLINLINKLINIKIINKELVNNLYLNNKNKYNNILYNYLNKHIF